MTNPPMLEDISRMLLALAVPAALLCLVLAGIALRREGGTSFSIGGGFSRWMFWAVVFITLPQLLSWFPSFGVPALKFDQHSKGAQAYLTLAGEMLNRAAPD